MVIIPLLTENKELAATLISAKRILGGTITDFLYPIARAGFLVRRFRRLAGARKVSQRVGIVTAKNSASMPEATVL